MADSHDPQSPPDLVTLETDRPIWDRFFTVRAAGGRGDA